MTQKNRITAAILALFTGMFGGHKLYLRDTGGFMMFVFLLMFTINIFGMPITALLGIFDAFRLFSMTDEQFDKMYNKGILKPKFSNVERRRQEQMKRYDIENQRRGYEAPTSVRKSVRSNPFKKSGIEKYKEFDLEGAIEDFNKGLEINPDDIALHYNLACAYSLTEKKELSFSHLAKAVELGFSDLERIMSHDDLAYLRIQPEFDNFKASGFRKVPEGIAQKPTTVEVAEATQSDDVLLSQLNRLAELKRRGILSEQEFLLEKNKLMRR